MTEIPLCEPLHLGCPALTESLHNQNENMAHIASDLRKNVQETATLLANKHDAEIIRMYERLDKLFDEFNARLNGIMQWVAVTAISASGALLIWILTKLLK